MRMAPLLSQQRTAPPALKVLLVVLALLAVTAMNSNEDKVEVSVESTWPWGGKNKTQPKNHTSDSCSTHKNCTACTSSAFSCHWCAHDQACHVKGSVFGCLKGVDCTNHSHDVPDDHKHKVDKSCASHKTCSECALSSSVCHWCAHDNACHEIGSIYGCASGVNCYSNDRCMRTKPEPISVTVFPEMGFGHILVIFAFSAICLCCATLGFCVAGGIKGAYDDLSLIAANNSAKPDVHRNAVAIEETEDGGEIDHLLVEDHEETTGYNLMEEVDDEEGADATPLLPQTPPARTSGSRHMRCLYNMCTVCYVVTIAAIALFTVGSIRYFPKRPRYNECSDEVAWKSIVDSMTSMSVKPTFEILLSLMNPNHFDVNLDMGKGTFKHKEVMVGTFDIPPTQAKAMSISDFMIVATLSPDKWEALSLSTEYYRGKLVLDVDTQATIRFPSLFNYSFEAEFPHIEVRVNELSDRSLCKCPQWKDVKNNTPSQSVTTSERFF